MEHVRCILCDADEPRELCRVRNDRYLRALGVSPPTSVKVMCSRCGHIYAKPQLDAEELSRLYRDVYRSASLGYADDRPSGEYLHWKELKAQRDYTWLKARLPKGSSPGRALEIGCAEGLLLSRLSRDGWDVVGVEPTSAYAADARQRHGISVIGSPFEEAAVDGPFDLIIALAVLEHIKAPFALLEKVRRLLAPDGLFFLTVPNVLDLGQFPEEQLASPHLSLFVPATLQRLLARSGIAVFEAADHFERLAALGRPADPAAAPMPVQPAVADRILIRAIRRGRVRARARHGYARARARLKRGLYGLVGPALADRATMYFRKSAHKPTPPAC